MHRHLNCMVDSLLLSQQSKSPRCLPTNERTFKAGRLAGLRTWAYQGKSRVSEQLNKQSLVHSLKPMLPRRSDSFAYAKSHNNHPYQENLYGKVPSHPAELRAACIHETRVTQLVVRVSADGRSAHISLPW